jgi:hypothetical protein
MIERVIKNIVSARHNRIVFFLLAGLALGVMEGCRTSHQSILDTFFIKVEEHFYGKKIVFEFQQAPKVDNSEHIDPPNSASGPGGFSPMVSCHSGRC